MEYIKIFGVDVEIKEIEKVSVYNNVLYKIKNCDNVGYDGIELVEGISDILYAQYEDDTDDCVFSLGHYNCENYGELFVKVISWRGCIDDIKVKDIG